MLAAFHVIEQRLPERSLLGSLVDRANLGAAHSKTCGVGESYMVIDQRGDVAKCQMEIEQPVTNVRAADPLGLIRADTIGVRNLPVQEKEGCRDCEWQTVVRRRLRESPPSARPAATMCARRTAASTPRSTQPPCAWRVCECSSTARASITRRFERGGAEGAEA